MSKRKPIGKRGSWFATVGGELLPCVHQHWFQPGPKYEDPGVEVGNPIWDEFIEELKKTGKVIVTSDDPAPGTGAFRRTGYIAIWSIDNVRVEEGCLRFCFIERLEELQ